MWSGLILGLLVGLIIWTIFIWFVIKLFDRFKMKKLKGRYKEEDDPGRKFKAGEQSGFGFRSSGSSPPREPDIQKSVEHAKRELLSSGVSKLNYDYSKSLSAD